MCDWVDIFSALLTPTIAVFGSLIAIQQWLTNRRRLKYELFDRRFKVYDTAKSFLNQFYANRHPTDEELYRFRLNTRESHFLFDEDIANYLEGWITKAYEVKTLDAELAPLPVGDARSENVRKQREIFDWFLMQQEVLEDKFEPYLKLKH
jgi:hypothetical protein